MSANKQATLASSFAAWCKKTFFGSKDPPISQGLLVEETEPLRTYSEDPENTLAEPEECPICTTSTKNKLCPSIPCQHLACERCWVTWQKEQGGKTCMICAQPIQYVNYNTAKGENRTRGSLVQVVDEALEDALRWILRIKNELLDIVDKVDETQAHISYLLESAQHGVFDGDSAVPIVQVEIATTFEQLEKLIKNANQLPQLKNSVIHLNKVTLELDHSLNSTDKITDWSRSTLITFAEILQPTSKEKKTALYFQWKSCSDLFNDLLHSRLHIVHGMAMVMPSEGFVLLGHLERIKATVGTNVPVISEKVNVFESEAESLLNKIYSLKQQPEQEEKTYVPEENEEENDINTSVEKACIDRPQNEVASNGNNYESSDEHVL